MLREGACPPGQTRCSRTLSSSAPCPAVRCAPLVGSYPVHLAGLEVGVGGGEHLVTKETTRSFFSNRLFSPGSLYTPPRSRLCRRSRERAGSALISDSSPPTALRPSFLPGLGEEGVKGTPTKGELKFRPVEDPTISDPAGGSHFKFLSIYY